MTLARLLISFALLCLPIVLYVAASRKSENAIWLMFPIVGAIPAVLGALLIFVPIEIYLSARTLGHLKNVAIPLAGSLLILVSLALQLTQSGDRSRWLSRLSKDPLPIVGPLLFWSVLGAIWGVVWRLSDYLLGAMGLTTPNL